MTNTAAAKLSTRANPYITDSSSDATDFCGWLRGLGVTDIKVITINNFHYHQQLPHTYAVGWAV